MWKSIINATVMGMLLWSATFPVLAQEADKAGGRAAMEWQMLPGESLNSLAALFYPRDRAMQRRFVASAVHLNREHIPDISGAKVFDAATQLQIPTLYDLSRQAGKGRKRAAPRNATPAPLTPEQMMQDAPPGAAPASIPTGQNRPVAYQSLEKRVEQRQLELEKLNARLKSLEEQTRLMQDSIKANAQPLEEARSRRLKRLN